MNTFAAAAALGLTPDTVRRQCHRGRFPGAVVIGRDWDIPVEAVEAYRAASLGKPGLAAAAYTAPNPRARDAGTGDADGTIETQEHDDEAAE